MLRVQWERKVDHLDERKGLPPTHTGDTFIP